MIGAPRLKPLSLVTAVCARLEEDVRSTSTMVSRSPTWRALLSSNSDIGRGAAWAVPA